MVEDTPDDLAHEVFTASFWPEHPLGRPILGTAESVGALDAPALRGYFADAYTAGNLVISAAGSVDAAAVRDLVGAAFAPLAAGGRAARHQRALRRSPDRAARQGPGAGAPVPGHARLPAEPRGPLRHLRAQHGAGRLDELAAVPEHPREAGAGLRGQQQPDGLPGRRRGDGVRRLRRRGGRRGRGPGGRGAARHAAHSRCRPPSCSARRTT